MRKRKKNPYVTKPIPENVNPPYIKFEKTKHVTCRYGSICNKFGSTPSEQCVKAACPFAVYSEFEVEVTAKGYRRSVNFGNFID